MRGFNDRPCDLRTAYDRFTSEGRFDPHQPEDPVKLMDDILTNSPSIGNITPKLFSYAQDFTPDVEIASIDEGYFDLTGVRKPALDVAHATPLVADANGYFPAAYASGSVKIVVTDASNATLYTLDPAFRTPSGSAAASQAQLPRSICACSIRGSRSR